MTFSSEREEILVKAIEIVMKDRNIDYGPPERNFARIAQMFSAYLDVAIQPYDVAVLLMLVKVARISNSPHKADHWIDIAGYAACGGEVRPGHEQPR